MVINKAEKVEPPGSARKIVLKIDRQLHRESAVVAELRFISMEAIKKKEMSCVHVGCMYRYKHLYIASAATANKSRRLERSLDDSAKVTMKDSQHVPVTRPPAGIIFSPRS